MEALKSGRTINKVMVSQHLNQNVQQTLYRESKKANVVMQKVPKQRLDQLAKGNHQGVIAYVAAYRYATMDELFQKAAERNEAPFFIILDELEDPHNLGSILRTADATGVHGVIIPKNRSVGLTETVAKTAAGALEHVPVVRVTNIADTLDKLKKEGMWVAGTAGDAKNDYRTLDGQLSIAIVIGNEGKGMTRLVQKNCDWVLRLPMKGHNASLNASVACSLLMYEVYRQRYPLGQEP